MAFLDLSKNESGRRDAVATARKALTVGTDIQRCCWIFRHGSKTDLKWTTAFHRQHGAQHWITGLYIVLWRITVTHTIPITYATPTLLRNATFGQNSNKKIAPIPLTGNYCSYLWDFTARKEKKQKKMGKMTFTCKAAVDKQTNTGKNNNPIFNAKTETTKSILEVSFLATCVWCRNFGL